MPDRESLKQASVKLNEEIFSLNPSALITLFEIDITNLLFNAGWTFDAVGQGQEWENKRIFRFHNLRAYQSSIWWNNKEYFAAPIVAEGFEVNSRGTLPVPKLALSVRPEEIPLLATLKLQIKKVGDLVGGKVTRIRTLAKFLDAKNFPPSFENEDADPYAEFPRDIFYIDRKSNENKQTIEYELASILDVEGVQLPHRLVISDRCPWTYRGEGCLYEKDQNRTEIHGEDAVLLTEAPSVATENDEKIADILEEIYPGQGWKEGYFPFYLGEWMNYNITNEYWFPGNETYIEKDGIKYYFISKKTQTAGMIKPPPDNEYWIADMCSKTLRGCKLRWGKDANGNPSLALNVSATNPHEGCLPFGGFPGINKARQ